MTWLLRGGISKLSELEIDVDKDWQAFGISNIKELAAAMTRGDILVRDDDVLVRILPGTIGHVLTSSGPLHLPVWAPPSTPLDRTFPVVLTLGHEAGVFVPDHERLITAPMTSPHSETTTPTEQGDLSLSHLAALFVADASRAENADMDGIWAAYLRVAGAVADDGGVQTDETAAANSAAANDMTLLPAVPAVNDAYYWALEETFDLVRLNVGTAGDWVGTLTWEYWDSLAWSALAGVTDETNGFRDAGGNRVTFTIPGDWAQTAVGALGPFYWVRARVSAYTSIITQPLGTQAWVGKAG